MSRRAIIFACFAIGYFLSNFFRAANAVIAADLTRDLRLTPADLGLMTSLFYAGFSLVQLPLGAALDRIGPRLAIPALMLVGAAGAAVFASAESFAALAVGRALIGIGMAGGLMGAIKAFGVWFPRERVASVTSLMVGLGASGGLAAATPLAWLNQAFGWRAVFVWGAGLVVLSAALIAAGARNAPDGVTWRASGQAGEGSFGMVFGDARFWRIAPINFFMIGGLLGVQTLWGGPYLFDVLGLTPLQAGDTLLFLSGGVVLGYFVCGPLAERFGVERVFAAAGVVFVAALAVFAAPGWAPPLAVVRAAFLALGMSGSFNLILLAQVRGMFPAAMSGRAATALNMFGFGGAALLQWWMGVVIGWFPAEAGRSPSLAYAAAFGAVALGNAACLAWYATLRRGGRRAPRVGAEG